ncbi:hypothetical protein EA462_07745 [Natrarchaeobius halalkaliphilus]|uniref:DUF7984 domain-containing protein n=1 Tax=Natrarchaeobius halalkaliphilus TaxID=1679091 RepID=A0A3N6P3L0_9EURY|nr:hypothetical protein [Natrarchaeobius halalkaliphilus]RQG89895.1 hypothetical protein EA462_07745 [Natrarchaeobius halalkaliphilus]
MNVTRERVGTEREWIKNRSNTVVPVINDVRDDLGEIFDTDVDPVTETQYVDEVDTVFADGDLAVNVAALVAILRELDVTGDHPGFVVDELLGRELAATIAGTQPLRTLGEATFHYADLHVHGDDDENAGVDDLEAALAAGFQERIPGWSWTERESPFALESTERP